MTAIERVRESINKTLAHYTDEQLDKSITNAIEDSQESYTFHLLFEKIRRLEKELEALKSTPIT